MIAFLVCFPECKDWILLLIGALISLMCSIVGAYYLYYSKLLKPNLRIESAKIVGKEIHITVVNLESTSAVNINIEACFFNENTWHIALDKEDFLIIPPLPADNRRTFKGDNLTPEATKYDKYENLLKKLETLDKGFRLRVRVFATHEHSGFGRAFEALFKWDGTALIIA